MKSSSNDSDKGKPKFTPNKEKDTKSKSPTNPESEYDFDQHLLEVKMSEKNQFLNSFNLKPSASTESQQQKSTKNDTKTEQTTDTAAKENKTLSPSTSKKETQSINQNTSDSNIDASNSSINDAKRLENKTSKRKSREPVKNIMKAKCVTPNIENELKWQTNSPNNGQSPLTLSRSSPINLTNERTETTPSTASTSKINMQMIDMWSQQNKNHLNSKHQRTSGPFKVPESKDLHKTSETETSIIINNVQRPNQADTPRPPMLIDPEISSRIFPMGLPNNRKHHLFNETEIKEIAHDDARKVKVYGPSMSTTTPLANPMRTGKFPAFMQKLNKQNELPKSMKTYKQPLDTLNLVKKIKPRSNSSGSIDLKKLNSTGELEVTSSTINKGNITPKRPASDDNLPRNEQKNVQKFLESANISIPKYLEVTLTNDDNDTSRTQSTFSQNKTPVNNYIEILKLPDELSSNSPNQERSRSSSPVVINLVSNKPSTSTPIQNITKPFPLNAPTPSTSSSITKTKSSTEFQEKFLESLRREKATKPRKKLPKPFHPPMLGHTSPFGDPPSLLPQKRKPNLLNTIPKRFQRSPAERLAPIPMSSPVDMEFSDIAHLAHQNNNKNFMQLPAMSARTLFAAFQFQQLQQQQRQGLNNRDSGSGSGANIRNTSSSDITSGSGSGQKTDYLPIPTSSKPCWSEHFTPAQKAEHESLMERLKKN